MQILLLLSALLSAMTGGLSGAGRDAVRLDHAEARLVAPALAPQRAAIEAPRRAETCAPDRRSAEASSPVLQNPRLAPPLATVCLIE